MRPSHASVLLLLVGAGCFPPARDASAELTWGFGVTPAIRVDERFTVFGGMFLRNHPTIERKGEEMFAQNDEDTATGPTNFLLHAGAAVRLGAFTALVLVQQNVADDPVRYGPSIGFALSASIDPGIPPPASAEPEEDKIAEARARMHRARARRNR